MSTALELEPITSAIGIRAPGRERTSVRTAPAGRHVYRRDEVEAVGLLVVILAVLVVLALTLGVSPLP